MTRFDLTTIGEGGLRLRTASGSRLLDADAFDVEVIGAELNVAGSLANLGWSCGWVSAVHDSPIGQRVLRAVATHGVDVSAVNRPASGRTGVYYVEIGSAPRPTSVLYDRDGTCFAGLVPDEVAWDYLLDTRVLHLTGLTAGLGPGPHSVASAAIERAADRGVAVSFDVNYRQNLWSPDTAADVLKPMMDGVEVLFCPHADAERLFGPEPSPERQMEVLAERTGAANVFMSIGAEGLLSLIDGVVGHTPSVTGVVVDRLGAGDGLAAGVLHAFLRAELPRAPILGATMAGLALSQTGEQVLTTADELDELATDATTSLRR